MMTEGFVLIKNGSSEQAFQLKEIELSTVNPNEVLIECEAFGLNYADVMARLGLYREAPPMPCVIGYEVVGIVKEVGSNVSQTYLGKRVVGFTRFGGYAKHAITSEDAIVEIGDLDANTALSLATQGVTAYYMSCIATTIQPNDRILIHAAAGGVGTLLIQIAKSKGAIVYAKVGNASKIEQCRTLGADEVIDYSTGDYSNQLKSILGNNSLDLSFNPVGGSTYKKDLSLLGSTSKIVLFGGSELSSGKWGIFSKLNFVRKMGFFTPIVMMMQSKSVIGINMLKVADHRPDILRNCLTEVYKLYQSGIIAPVEGGMFQKDELAKAHALLESGKSTGKISVHW